MVSLTFYGGVREIGGNKFEIEHNNTRIMLDFGKQFKITNKYFAEFLEPRKFNGLGDFLEFGLIPDIKGLYRNDYLKHMGRNEEPNKSFEGILLTHAHADHSEYIHFLRDDVMLYCSEETKLILEALEVTGSGQFKEYLMMVPTFKLRDKKTGTGKTRVDKGDETIERSSKVTSNGESIDIGSFKVESWYVDHSIPGVYAFIIRPTGSTGKSIAYTGDIRFHGRKKADSDKFVEKAQGVDILLCEGTRVDETGSETEESVETKVKSIINSTEKLVVASWPNRDLDRLLSFYNAAKDTGRTLVIDIKQAYILDLFEGSEETKGAYPKIDDPNIRVYIQRKSWGLYGRDESEWPSEIIKQDYEGWEWEFIEKVKDNSVLSEHIKERQSDFVFYCNDFQVKELISIQPEEGSSYIRSVTEPFNEEMVIDEERVKNWLRHFKIKADPWYQIHVSGHGSGDQIKQLIEKIRPKTVIPIHTENEQMFLKWHDNVRFVEVGKEYDAGNLS